MFVKICGITRPEDARAAEAAGADAIGMIFVPGSKRQLTMAEAEPVAAAVGPFVTRVGVFRDAPVHEVRATASRLRLHVIQLHGDEDQHVIAELRDQWTVVKAVRFEPALEPETLAAYGADAILLDGLDPGSGTAFDWQAAAALKGMDRLVLAGGLTPVNVARAIEAMHPFAVDVASGVEAAPGIKDPAKISAFVSTAKAARDPWPVVRPSGAHG